MTMVEAKMVSDTVQTAVERIVDGLNGVQTDGHWQVGKVVAEAVSTNGLRSRLPEVCRALVEHPKTHLSYAYLRQCVRTYTYYPDAPQRPLSSGLYFVLANRVYREEDRARFEQLAIERSWNANQLATEIRKEARSRKEESRTELGFDLQLTNLWYFNTADPRFGKPEFRGRIAGQIIANALYYFGSGSGAVIDVFAGSGTLGDIIDKLPFFADFQYVMFDLSPCDGRIRQNDVMLHGIPLPSNSAGYIFLDPPYANLGERYYGTSESDLSRMAPGTFLAVMFSVIRECKRVLTPGRNVSLIIEPIMPFDDDLIDLPFQLAQRFVQEGFEPVSKVYVPNQTMRNEGSMPNIIGQSRRKKKLISDCRELLTFCSPR